MQLDPSIFKAYDIRGIAGEQLNAELAGAIGKAFAKIVNPTTVIVGRDGLAPRAARRGDRRDDGAGQPMKDGTRAMLCDARFQGIQAPLPSMRRPDTCCLRARRRRVGDSNTSPTRKRGDDIRGLRRMRRVDPGDPIACLCFEGS